MVVTVILFFIALALAFGMIARRIWLLRRGRLVIEPSYEHDDWTEISVESMRTEFIEWAKFMFHHGILLALKLWILLSNLIKRADKNIKTKLTRLLHKNARLPDGGSPSHFLKDIRAHKDSVTNAIKKEAGEEITGE